MGGQLRVRVTSDTVKRVTLCNASCCDTTAPAATSQTVFSCERTAAITCTQEEVVIRAMMTVNLACYRTVSIHLDKLLFEAFDAQREHGG